MRAPICGAKWSARSCALRFEAQIGAHAFHPPHLSTTPLTTSKSDVGAGVDVVGDIVVDVVVVVGVVVVVVVVVAVGAVVDVGGVVVVVCSVVVVQVLLNLIM
jgi:hypothetical protein